ncbi:outer membrane protein [Nitrosomonas cryotolerans]|uniref:Outer membrane protein n=1 Tax=Nitrosomonas cryotolerans ATCC 49181 TaxID=1131553 RepID=A0A1N6F3L2_9PROT|nr:TolC family outer membrane protein [Nitrosomonas cryotolerans]SFP70459.1 outer membrane protein [Nitrosomonas cryotolerans]SIN89855.1 outer membrane protein [Nitrosomonas cryotolerans ATCC 49181]
MKFLQYVYILIGGIILHSQVYAANLMDIYKEALDRDAQYQSARAAYLAAQEKLPQGRAGLLPNIVLSGTRQTQKVDTNLGSEVTIQNRGVVISATQPLIRVENFIIFAQSKVEVAQADSQFVLAAQDLILRVAQAYFDILSAQVDVEVAEAQKKAILKQLEQAKRNFEVGVSTIVDTNEAQARFDLTIAQEIAAQNALEISKRTLQGIIDRFPENLTSAQTITSDLSNLSYASMEEWVKVAEEKNFSLKIQQAAYDLAQQEVKKAWAQHYPTLDLVAQYSDQTGVGGAITGRGIDLTSKSIGLQLNIPLFEGFAVQSRVREALANQDKASHDLDNARRNNALQVRQQYLNVTNGIAQVKALKQALVSSQKQLDSTLLGQEVGVRIEIDVLNAQQQLYSAKRDLAKAYYNYLMARLRLKAETGELDEDTLQQINNML